MISACIDRLEEDYAGIDCDTLSANLLELELQLCSEIEGALDLYPECHIEPLPDEEEEEIQPNDEEDGSIVDENYPPYFARVDEFRPKLHELARGSVKTIQLSEYRDENPDDDVTLTASLTQE